MNEEEMAELLQNSSPKELYIVTWNNVLKCLFCPFKVVVNESIGTLIKGQILSVDEVKVTMELITVYLINERYYFYFYFEIIVE